MKVFTSVWVVPAVLLSAAITHSNSSPIDLELQSIDSPMKLEKLNIDPKGVFTAGCSHAADFAHQYHIAYSSYVKGACIFSGQPFHCAVTKFARDAQVPQTPESSVPRCDGCDNGMTLIYDHCKNHPEWVDVGKLPDYPRRACGNNPVQPECIDDPQNLFDARVFLFRGTHDRCYLHGAVENVHALYSQMVTDPVDSLKLVTSFPFPHTLPTNSTPYFNSTVPAMYDGPGNCMRWVYNQTLYAGEFKQQNAMKFDQTEFIDDKGVGLKDYGFIYIPDMCKNGSVQCKMAMLTDNCGGSFNAVDWAKYGEANGIVILQACVGGYVDAQRFPNATEIQRGLLDVYGQLSEDYSMQSGYHMRAVGKVMKRVMGMD